MIYPKRYLVTSALPYANGPLHIGHLTGAYISADIYVRFLRLLGKDVVWVCGSDEHGAAITIRAMKEGLTPQEVVDQYHVMLQDSFAKLGISFNIYHRTSSPLHHETSQDFFRTLYNKGIFEEQSTEQYYDEKVDQFLADRYIKGICPKCGHPEAYGDQCENCGSSLSPTDLINPVSTLTGSKPILKETTHWYLPLNKDEGWLREWIESGILDGTQVHDPAEWKAHVLGQCKSWLDSGLQPRAITRDLNWGVDVPPEIPGSKGKKLYVWMDAPIGYISATKQWAIDTGNDWKPYWQDAESALIHFIGKDNIVFHCLIFPAILKAHGDYVLPMNVPANQFMNLEGDKISTSRNWAVWVHEYLEDFPGREDALRYYLTKNMPEQRDSEFTWKGFQEANDNELVNNLANFIHRVFVLTHNYYAGVVPDFDPELSLNSASGTDMPSWHDSEMLDLHDQMDALVHDVLAFDFRGALTKLMGISSTGNQLLQFNEPWSQQMEDPDTVKVVMNLALQYVTALSLAMYPFLPFTATKLRALLNLPPLESKGEWAGMMLQLAEGEKLIVEGHQIQPGEHLFTRLDPGAIEQQIAKLKKPEIVSTDITKSSAPAVKLKPEIQYDDFAKLDIRTASILSAERVEKADKLLKLELDLGFERRTVISGIAKHYDPKDIIGRSVILLANLAPRKIRGVESKGMILMAENGAGKLCFVSPDEGWENGAGIS
ncbi:MAG TPA: methionine--tRNA ligase [Saprospiraceae bacterium]|nr:methionine--tRNA ligase [Saprospiraceae bacterium]